jgi:hypothetical protein
MLHSASEKNSHIKRCKPFNLKDLQRIYFLLLYIAILSPNRSAQISQLIRLIQCLEKSKNVLILSDTFIFSSNLSLETSFNLNC